MFSLKNIFHAASACCIPPPLPPFLPLGESVTKLKGMLQAAQEVNPAVKEVSKSGFSFRHPDAPPPFDDVSSRCRARVVVVAGVMAVVGA